MILVDVNLLIYAKMAGLPQHERAREWFDAQLNGSSRVALPWFSLVGFVRIVTNRRAFSPPLSIEDAWRQVEEWTRQPGVWSPGPTEAHGEVLGRLLRSSSASAGLVSDAHLAALAIEHGLAVCSTDGDFARFDGLRWHNPLR